jgi:hypothetical protein
MDFHKTRIPNIFGFIEKNHPDTITGWFVDFSTKSPLQKSSLKVLNQGEEITFEYGLGRKDVSEFYKDSSYAFQNCGIQISIPQKDRTQFEIQYFMNGKWTQLYALQFQYNIPELAFSSRAPSFLVVDNFYNNADIVRNYALSQEFIFNPNNHKGKRTEIDFHNDSLKNEFERLLGVPIQKWDYKWNGCFQYCTAEDKLVIHCDVQNYAAIVFLTPDAPPSTGTSFYRHKKMKNRHYRENTFTGGHYDFTDFDLVDTVGNVYNRLVIFDAQLIHSATEYFGTSKENGRLFQIFFFDI